MTSVHSFVNSMALFESFECKYIHVTNLNYVQLEKRTGNWYFSWI